MENQVIVGDADVSRAAFVRRKITNLVKAENTSFFDLAELFHETKKKQFYAQWGYPSFNNYCNDVAKDYQYKASKIYYSTRIMENMEAAGLERSQFEQVGRTKLRMISRLKPYNADGSPTMFNGIEIWTLIRDLTLKAAQMSPEEVSFEVDKILGLTEDEAMSWMNIKVKKLAKDNVIMPALALAKKHVGSVGEDENGQAQDASDGRALELICANFLADPNYNIAEITEVPSSDTTQAGFSPTDLLIPSDETLAKVMGDDNEQPTDDI